MRGEQKLVGVTSAEFISCKISGQMLVLNTHDKQNMLQLCKADSLQSTSEILGIRGVPHWN